MKCLFKNAKRIAEMFTLLRWRENKIHNYYRLCSTRDGLIRVLFQ